MKIKPLSDRILISSMKQKKESKGGIVIPDMAREKPQEGRVIAVGAGKTGENGKRIPLEVKEGDLILMGKYDGTEVKIVGATYLIMREEDVLAILEK